MTIEQTVFIFLKRDILTDDIASMFAMLLLTVGFIYFAHTKQEPLSIFPRKFGLLYIMGTTIFIILMAINLAVTGNITWQIIVTILYSYVITPTFEEIVFRGFIWNKVKKLCKKEWVTYLITTLLFAIWHLGYIDGVAFRVSQNLAVIMIWKMITGLCFGIILGVMRMKSKNCYSTILLHGIMNMFGR